MYDKRPLVSIVTATYKKFDKLFETMKSVFEQSYPLIEYIITDDGSDNFPKEKITSYVNTYQSSNVVFHIIHHETNIGTVKNLNFAYKEAKGTYILNLSCGDVFFRTDVVDNLVERFLKTNCKVLVASRILYRGSYEPICFLPHYEERKIISSMKSGIDQYKAFVTSRYYDMASGSAMYFCKTLLEEMDYFDESYYLWEDGPFLARYLQEGKLECAYDIVSIWYENNGVSSVRADKKLKNRSTAQSKLQKDADLFNKSARIQRLDLMSFHQKRLIKYRNARYDYRDSVLLYFVYLYYFPEFISSIIYGYARKRRIQQDLSIIKLLLNSEQVIK